MEANRTGLSAPMDACLNSPHRRSEVQYASITYVIAEITELGLLNCIAVVAIIGVK